MKIKFTDSHRFPHGYKQACDTDISRTWERARKKMEEDRKEREASQAAVLAQIEADMKERDEKVRDLKKLKGAK